MLVTRTRQSCNGKNENATVLRESEKVAVDGYR
jgi:hypothetical protein